MQCGIAPDYVLDRMELYEMEALIDNLWMRSKESWEQTRTLSFVTAQCQSTKPLDMKAMMTFPWEKEHTEKVEDTQEEREQIMREMKEMERMMNTKK